MKKLLIAFLLLASCAFAGEDAGLAGAAYVKAKNLAVTSGDQVLANATGTVSLPIFSFSADPDNGVYLSGPNALSVAIAGAARALLNATSLTIYGGINAGGTTSGYPNIAGVAPSSTVPNFTWIGDTNSGIGRNAADQPSVIANSTEMQRWTNQQIYEPLVNTGGVFISRTSIKGYKLTTDANATRLTVDGAADSASNRWAIASGTTYMGTVHVSGIATDSTRASVGYSISFKAQRVNSTVTVATGSIMIIEDSSLTGCSADIAADSTNGAFYVSVIGSTTTNVRWGAVAEYMEVNQP